MEKSWKTISNIVLWTALLSVVVLGVHGATSSAVIEPPKGPEQREHDSQEQQPTPPVASLDSAIVGTVYGGGVGDPLNLDSKDDSTLNEKTVFIKVGAGIPLPPGPRSARGPA